VARTKANLGSERRIFGSRLPPGIQDIDCDGGHCATSEVSDGWRWQICGPLRQERIATRFVKLHLELLRDAILDAEDSSSPSGTAREFQLGKSLWSAWRYFRGRALGEMNHGGI
jgi:hypothetical protein